MLVDGRLSETLPSEIVAAAREHELAGYGGLFSAESAHDPFLPHAVAAGSTERIQLGTAVAIAFARSPMQLAYTAHDLQAYSRGRFVLGLGSQVKAHINRRFSMEWSEPAKRMREYIVALQSIWASWDHQQKLDFAGDFYQHTLMPPFFCPPPNPTRPPIYLAAVGERMTHVAGEVADGILTHGFTTPRYLREVTLPAVEVGLATSSRTREQFAVSYLGFVVTGPTEEQMDAARQAVRERIAFYGSTPAYAGVLALHGWETLQSELHALSRSDRADRWEAMGGLIDDEMLETFAVVAEPDAVAGEILRRFDGLVDRFSFYAPYPTQFELWTQIVAELSAAATQVSVISATGGGM